MEPCPIAGPSLGASAPVQPPRLLDQLRQAARARGDPATSVEVLVSWARAYILFHDKKHPATLGLAEVTHFL